MSEKTQEEIEIDSLYNQIDYWYARCLEAEALLRDSGHVRIEISTGDYDIADEGSTD